MELFIDDHPTDSDSAGNGNLEDALRRIQSGLDSPNRMVVGLRCNGKDVAANDMTSTLQKPVSSFERLEVFTATSGNLVSEAMTQAAESLMQTEAECERIADSLTEGKTSEAMQALGECMSVWQQTHEAVSKSIQMLQLDPEQVEVDGERLIDVIAKPTDVLVRIKQALETQDHVLLADTLKYEFCDVTHQWHSIIAVIRGEAEAKPVVRSEST